MVALASPVVIGGMGMGGEIGYWYLTKQKLQNAADVAAHGAAIRLQAGDSEAAIQTLAEVLAGRADVNLAMGTVTANMPPLTGDFIEDSGAVEIIVTETVPRLFSAIYNDTPIELEARAVARAIDASTACILALNPTASAALDFTGNLSLTLVLCDAVANSTAADAIDTAGSAVVSAACLRTSGGYDPGATVTLDCGAPEENARAVPDPFADLAEPSLVGNCEDGNIDSPSDTTILTPTESHPSGMPSMRFCNGLDIQGTVTLNPGLYLIEGGDFRINATATVSGSGVMFYLADGVDLDDGVDAVFNGSATVNLSAPTTGDYAGVVIFASRSASDEVIRINGNFGSTMDGAVYAAASQIEFRGNVGSSALGCTQMVADTISMSGNVAAMIHCIFPPARTIDIGGDIAVVE